MVEEAHYKRSRPVGAESPVFLSQLSWHWAKLTGGELKYRKLVRRSLRELPPHPRLGGGLGGLGFLPSPATAWLCFRTGVRCSLWAVVLR